MKKSDKNLVRRATHGVFNAAVAAAGTALAAISGVDAPAVTFAWFGIWELAKAKLGNVIQLREQEAVEWIGMVKESASSFTAERMSERGYQAAFVASLDNYLMERDADKRTILRSIFLDFTKHQDLRRYPLERLQDITQKITFFDAKTFAGIMSIEPEHARGQPITPHGNTNADIESVFTLIYMGLLIREGNNPAIRESQETHTMPKVFVSDLGRHYYNFLKDLKPD